jgi:ERF superfamily protein
MEKSEKIEALALALSKAQAEIKASSLDGKNPHFGSEYSTLNAIWNACREALTKNGLSVIQTTDNEEVEHILLETTLLHSSGQWITGKLKMKPMKSDPQGIGSALTYARRYALAAIVGVAPEDDDAEAATNRSQKSPPAAAKKAETKPADIKQGYIKRINELWQQEKDLGATRPKDEVALSLGEMSADDLEKLGKTIGARVKSLADRKAAQS